MKSNIKIITGKYKGKEISLPESSDIRPTQNFIREAVFNTIQFEIEGASFLDMYAGTGSIGIEALSRGAVFVDFIDESYESISLIRKNLVSADKTDDYRLIKYKVTSKSVCSKQIRKYDFIFMDPPYKRGYINKGLQLIKRCDILSPNGVLIVESLENEKYDFEEYECYKEIKYNKKIVRFLKKELL